jgi:hypothetical protein
MSTLSFTGKYRSFILKDGDLSMNIKNYNVGTLNDYYIFPSNPYFTTVQDMINKLPSNFYNLTYKLNFNYSWQGTFIYGYCQVYLNSSILVSRDSERTVNRTIEIPSLQSVNLKAVGGTNDKPADCTYPIRVTIEVIIEISVFIDSYCLSNFENNICQTYCGANQDLCIPLSLNYCFNTITPFTSKIFNGDFCPNFIQTALSQGKGSLVYDRKINQFCKSMGVTPSNYKEVTTGAGKDPNLDIKIKQLCACHFDQEVYDNYYNQLIQLYPQLANLATKQCLFPECTGVNLYKSYTMLNANVCPNISCINVSTLNNNGTISGGVTIDQSNYCKSVFEGSTGPQCTTNLDCPSNAKCIRESCVPVQSCVFSSDCEVNQKCYNQTCVSKEYCMSNRDCSNLQKCKNNVCVPLDSCTSDQECATGQTCINNLCSVPKSNLPWIIGGSIGAVVVLVIVIILGILFFKKK